MMTLFSNPRSDVFQDHTETAKTCLQQKCKSEGLTGLDEVFKNCDSVLICEAVWNKLHADLSPPNLQESENVLPFKEHIHPPSISVSHESIWLPVHKILQQSLGFKQLMVAHPSNQTQGMKYNFIL